MTGESGENVTSFRLIPPPPRGSIAQSSKAFIIAVQRAFCFFGSPVERGPTAAARSALRVLADIPKHVSDFIRIVVTNCLINCVKATKAHLTTMITSNQHHPLLCQSFFVVVVF